MANYSLSYLSLINQQVKFSETLQEYLLKAEALTTIALNNEYFYPLQSINYHYLWTLLDLISQSKSINDESLNLFLNLKKNNILQE